MLGDTRAIELMDLWWAPYMAGFYAYLRARKVCP